jgi:O-antigen ligase
VYWGSAFAIAAVALALSGSRGGGLAAVLGVVLMTLHAPAPRRWRTARSGLLILLVVLVVALSVSSQVGGDSLTERFRGTGDRDRRRAWNAAVEVWTHHPLTGVGYAVGDDVVAEQARSDDEPFRGGTAFNGYLQTLVDVGPAGVLLLALCLYAALRGAGRARGQPLESALFGSVAAGAALQMVEAGLSASGSVFAFLFWIEAAGLICLRYAPISVTDDGPRAARPAT